MKELRMVKGKIMYFYDEKNYKTINLYEIPSKIRINDESYNLEQKPSFFENGIPVWIIARDFPVPVRAELMKQKDRLKMVEKGYTASEIDAKIHSIYINTLFRRRIVNIENILLLIFTNLISILSMLLILKGG